MVPGPGRIASKPGNPQQLSVSDVQRLYDDFASFEASHSGQYDYSRALVLRNVDFRAYAADEASSLPMRPLGASVPRDATPVQGTIKAALIAEALRAYDRVAATRSPVAAYDWVSGAQWRLESPRPTRQDELLMALAPDFSLLNFMTKPPSQRGTLSQPEWSWRVLAITVEGTDTARITLSAKSLPNEGGWSFKDPARVYEKVWRFSYDPTQHRWRLAAWPNRTQFIESVRTNLADPKGEFAHETFYDLID